jgi:hypothetical protein
MLVDIARDPKFEKIKGSIGLILKSLSKVPEMDQRIKLRGATDLLNVTGPV